MANKIYTGKRSHISVAYTPLSVSCILMCMTPQSTCSQVYNVSSDEYEPDRGVSPCVVRPRVVALDKDGVFQSGVVNERLSLDTLQWYINSTPIGDVSAFKGCYTVVQTADENRGSISITKNLTGGERYMLSFKGQFEDWRTGDIITVVSDEIALTSMAKGDDKVTCSVDTPHIEYNMMHDSLLEYEYLVKRGLMASGERASYIDGNSYERTVTVCYAVGLTGRQTLPSDVTMELYKGNSVISPGTEEYPEVLQVEYPYVKFDLRLIDNATYNVVFLKDGEVQTRCTIGITRKMDEITDIFANRGADIMVGQVMYFNSCTVMAGDRALAYPDMFLEIVWKTQARTPDSNGQYVWADEKEWQTGEKMECEVADIGIGTTKNDAYFSTWMEASEMGALVLLADEDGNALADENGELLIG